MGRLFRLSQIKLFHLASGAAYLDVLHSLASSLSQPEVAQLLSQGMVTGSAHRWDVSLLLPLNGPDSDIGAKALGEFPAPAKLDLAHINPLSQPRAILPQGRQVSSSS